MASVAQPVDEPPPHTVNRFRVDDLLYLEPRTTDAAVLIERFGHWWKFQAGRKTGLECLLRSVHGKQKRSEPKSKVEMLVIGKAGDWRYDVTNMIPFPCGEADIPKAGK